MFRNVPEQLVPILIFSHQPFRLGRMNHGSATLLKWSCSLAFLNPNHHLSLVTHLQHSQNAPFYQNLQECSMKLVPYLCYHLLSTPGHSKMKHCGIHSPTFLYVLCDFFNGSPPTIYTPSPSHRVTVYRYRLTVVGLVDIVSMWAGSCTPQFSLILLYYFTPLF